MTRRGAFIVIEGLDRSGKSTQAALLHEHIQASGVDVTLMKFPDRTTAIGKMIDSYLRSESELDDHAIHLLFSANRWELATKIKSLLASGTTILADRYAFSGVAFSVSKNLPNLSYTYCRTPEIGLPAPDLTLFLDIDPAKARERGGYGEERYEKEEMQARVRIVFGRIREEIGSSWIRVDAGRGKEEVENEIWGLVEPLVSGVDGPLKSLWEEHLPPS